MNEIKYYIDQLELTDIQKHFFLGWCEEGGQEFTDILETVLYKAYSEGFTDCTDVN